MIFQFLCLFMTHVFEILSERNIYALHFGEGRFAFLFLMHSTLHLVISHFICLSSCPLSWLVIVFWSSSQLLLVVISLNNFVSFADLLSQCSIAFQGQFLYETQLLIISHNESFLLFSPLGRFLSITILCLFVHVYFISYTPDSSLVKNPVKVYQNYTQGISLTLCIQRFLKDSTVCFIYLVI